MTRSLSVAELLRLRLRAQQLSGGRAAEVAEVVRRTGAIQAQNTRAARLAVRVRGENLDAPGVDRASNVTRSVVRTWAMRGTLHMLAAQDIGWIVPLYRPAAEAVTSRHRELGLDAALFARAMPAIGEVLSGGAALNRAELVAALNRVGVAVPGTGQAPIHLIGYAARQGLVCRGPDRGDDDPTYVLLREWVGELEPVEPEQALVRLARRYIAAYGPAGAADFAYWSGFPLRRARQALAALGSDLAEVDIAGEPAWLLPGQDTGSEPLPCVRLLGHFDAYLLGYRSRDLFLPPAHARRIQAGGGMVRPAVVVDGRIVGTWRRERSGQRAIVAVEPFERLDPAVLPGLSAEVADLGRFYEVPTELRVVSGRPGL
jgi:hypothetical protein